MKNRRILIYLFISYSYFIGYSFVPGSLHFVGKHTSFCLMVDFCLFFFFFLGEAPRFMDNSFMG
jgi:hypothetical protein